MTDCAGIIGRIFGHKYRARFSTHVAGVSEAVVKTALERGFNVSMPFNQVYAGDVCERCGDVANVPANAQEKNNDR